LQRKIHQLLQAAGRDSNELFRVCAKFNPLFDRPRIKDAIRMYQNHLLGTIRKDIGALEDKLKLQFEKTEAKVMSKVADIPPVSGKIIWIRQIEKQLDMYIRRFQVVLGPNWQETTEGKPLFDETQTLRQRLKDQPTQIVNEWLASLRQLRLLKSDGPGAVDRARSTSVVTQGGKLPDGKPDGKAADDQAKDKEEDFRLFKV